MPRYAARIAYDGTSYAGFQRQRGDQPTIQGELERVLNGLIRQPVTVTGAGRTDSGVHAQGQVISFAADWHHGPQTLQRALNANLPADIAILQLDEVPSPFHPRFDARRRAYEYRIYNATVRNPHYRLTSWHVRRPLDVDVMNEAARHLVGVHDFATFGQPPQGSSRVREVFSARWRRREEQLLFFIEGNAFLYRMVRSLVGSLKLVGEGTWSVEEFVAAMQAQDRGRCGPVAPPQGLYLVSVSYYDADAGDEQAGKSRFPDLPPPFSKRIVGEDE